MHQIPQRNTQPEDLYNRSVSLLLNIFNNYFSASELENSLRIQIRKLSSRELSLFIKYIQILLKSFTFVPREQRATIVRNVLENIHDFIKKIYDGFVYARSQTESHIEIRKQRLEIAQQELDAAVAKAEAATAQAEAATAQAEAALARNREQEEELIRLRALVQETLTSNTQTSQLFPQATSIDNAGASQNEKQDSSIASTSRPTAKRKHILSTDDQPTTLLSGSSTLFSEHLEKKSRKDSQQINAEAGNESTAQATSILESV